MQVLGPVVEQEDGQKLLRAFGDKPGSKALNVRQDQERARRGVGEAPRRARRRAPGRATVRTPAVEGLPEFVHRELLDAQQDEGVQSGRCALRNPAAAHRPARDLDLAGIAPARASTPSARWNSGCARCMSRASGRGPEHLERPPLLPMKGSSLKARLRHRSLPVARCP